MKPLPIGIQTFSEIVNHDMVYIDKTDLIYQLVKPQKYFFLSRPRRFGKSLLISTLQAYFEGKKELFKDLKIEQLETEWTEYPVINLSFAKCKSKQLDVIVKFISIALSELEVQFGIIDKAEQPDDDKQPNINFNTRFERIIKTAHAKTGRQVVLLIDEYDTLMLNTITDIKTQDEVRTHMSSAPPGFSLQNTLPKRRRNARMVLSKPFVRHTRHLWSQRPDRNPHLVGAH